jgi:uncharacterized membrane protein YeiH
VNEFSAIAGALAQVEELEGAFILPKFMEYGATLIFALSGALLAARRGYDLSGVMAIAIVSSTGGGLLRDGIFLNQGPPALVQNWVYLALVATAALTVGLLGRWVARIPRFDLVISLSDSAGIPMFAIVGMLLSRNAGLGAAAAVLIGIVNAIGGGLLRDLLVNREPDIFRPGVPIALAAAAACVLFLLLNRGFDVVENLAAWITISLVAVVRSLALYFNVRTRRIIGFDQIEGL